MGRIIFIPGLGEDQFIFSKIAPEIKGEKVVLNIWDLFTGEARNNLDAIQFAKEFIASQNVTADDVLIGHSLGGWIAYHVKHLIGCPIIHIASMTNTDRIVAPVINHEALYTLVRSGIAFNDFTTWLSTATGLFHQPESKEIFAYIAKLLQKENKEKIVNQLKVVLTPVKEIIKVQPDLRIHAKKDGILKPPVEPYFEVPGDHFTLFTFPETVLAPIQSFLKNLPIG